MGTHEALNMARGHGASRWVEMDGIGVKWAQLMSS